MGQRAPGRRFDTLADRRTKGLRPRGIGGGHLHRRHQVRRALPARSQRMRLSRRGRPPRERNRPASRSVDVHDDSAFEASGLDEFQAQRHGQFGEQCLPAAKGHWLDDQAVFIDQPPRGKGRGEAGATVDDDIGPWLLFSAAISASRSPRAIRVMGQEAWLSVLEKAILGMSFMGAAYGSVERVPSSPDWTR